MVIAEEVYHAYEHDMMELYSQNADRVAEVLMVF